MNRRFESHLFWGSHSPLSALGGIGLVILASGRFSFALICSGALIWVFGLTALVFSGARPIMPARGRLVILLFLSAFFCAVFMLLMGLLNPLLILGMGFFLLLIPPCCLGSGLFEASGEGGAVDPIEVFSRALKEAMVLSGVILALALVREPLGLGALSFPGGAQGIIEIFGDPDRFIPVKFLSASAGGLVLLGYVIALYRYLRVRNGTVPEEGR